MRIAAVPPPAAAVTCGLVFLVGCASDLRSEKSYTAEHEGRPGEAVVLVGVQEKQTTRLWQPNVSPLGPVLYIVTIGLTGGNTPWYTGFNIILKEHVSDIAPDGAVASVSDTEAVLRVHFKGPITLLQSEMLEANKDALLAYFRTLSAYEQLVSLHSDPYHFRPVAPVAPGAPDTPKAPSAPAPLQGEDEKMQRFLSNYPVRTLHYEWVTDQRDARGELLKQIHGGYRMAVPPGGGKLVLTKVLGSPAGQTGEAGR